MRFSEQLLATVRDRASIASYAGRKLSWDNRKSQPAKGDYWACCPFHGEKTSSFHVLDRKGLYKCFGCGEAGDIFKLAMKLEGLSFPEAVERIANDAGVTLPREPMEDSGALQRRKRLYEACTAAQTGFVEALASREGDKARAYLEKRGLDAATRQKFGLGYAPAGPAFIANRLMALGFTEAEVREAGLAKGDDGRRPYDHFRDRVMFPIADAQGRIVGFGGRALDPNQPAKYVNSPETPLFSKGRLLYRHKEAREILARTKGKGLIVAEGYLDVIAFERAGVPAVAPLGTALTEDQLELLWRAGPAPILCFDGDKAGLRAADRALDLALPKLAPNRTIAVAILPEGQDPDDVFRASGPEALASLLEHAKPAVEALVAREIAREPLTTPEARAGLKQRLRDAAGRIADADTRREYLKDVLARADAALAGALPRREWRPSGGGKFKGGKGGGSFQPASASAELKARLAGAARPGDAPAIEQLLRGACESALILERGGELLADLAIADPDLDRIRDALLRLRAAGETVDQSALSRHLADSGEESAAACVRRWPASPWLTKTADADEEGVAGPIDAAPATSDLAVDAFALHASETSDEELRRRDEAEWRRRLEGEWMALATLLVTRPEIEADLAGLLARDGLDDDAFARAVAMKRAQRDVDRALLAAREARPPTTDP